MEKKLSSSVRTDRSSCPMRSEWSRVLRRQLCEPERAAAPASKTRQKMAMETRTLWCQYWKMARVSRPTPRISGGLSFRFGDCTVCRMSRDSSFAA
ncbi:hypothetical protein DSECCO2_429480 [anaerobic digester metagenome]